MKRLTKAEREQIRQMFDGRCAYCGDPLGARWHVDHVQPVMRGVGSYWSGKSAAHMENHRIDNMMPACAPCNISKATYSLEQWRGVISGHVGALARNLPTYRLARKYGLIQETGMAVEFYFERVALSELSRRVEAKTL